MEADDVPKINAVLLLDFLTVKIFFKDPTGSTPIEK